MIMSAENPRWSEFQHRLAARVVVETEPLEFNCSGDYEQARRILTDMGFGPTEIALTVITWGAGRSGNCCDCELVMNAALSSAVRTR